MALQCKVQRSGGIALLLWFGLLGVTQIACTATEPTDKFNYLKQFRVFVEDVKANCDHYRKSGSKADDRRFQLYARDGYRRFADQLTPRERVTVLSYCGQYFQCRFSPDDDLWMYKQEELLLDLPPHTGFQPAEEWLISSPAKNRKR